MRYDEVEAEGHGKTMCEDRVDEEELGDIDVENAIDESKDIVIEEELAGIANEIAERRVGELVSANTEFCEVVDDEMREVRKCDFVIGDEGRAALGSEGNCAEIVDITVDRAVGDVLANTKVEIAENEAADLSKSMSRLEG